MQPTSNARRLAAPVVRSAIATLLFGGVVVMTFSPAAAAFVTSPNMIVFILLAAGVAAMCWVGRNVRRLRAHRSMLTVTADERQDALLEIGWLEELHRLPAQEPNRSAYTRNS